VKPGTAHNQSQRSGVHIFARSLISRLKFNADGDTLPIQITTLTIISRWVLAAILSEVRGAKAHKSLREILEKQVPSLFAATKVFPDLSQQELLATIMQTEANMGMSVEQGADQRNARRTRTGWTFQNHSCASTVEARSAKGNVAG
jgi:hypothetical protein